MKISLVLPPISLKERYNKALSKVTGSLPPLGLLTIGTVLKNAGHNISILDGSIMSLDNIMAEIGHFGPDIVGITSMTLMWPKVKLLSNKLKETWPALNIIAGGVHVTLIREKALFEIPDIDAVCWGEGEFSMLEYVENFNNLHLIGPIDGVAYRLKDGNLAVGQDREPINDLNALPIPDRAFVPVTQYVPAIEQYKKLPVTNMLTTRGCPFKCIFCLPDLLGKGVRYRSADNVIKEIDYLVGNFNIKEIAFWDDTFTVNKKRVFNICERIIESKNKIIWSAQARADCVTQDMLNIMSEAGCWKVFYGVESLVQKNLDTIKKGETVEQIFAAIEWTKKAGIEVEASFIFGIPGETFQEGLETIRLAKKLDPDYAKFFYLHPYGKLLEEIIKNGTLLTEDERNFRGSEITFVPYSMTKEELYKLYHMAYREFYFRPKAVYKRLKKIGNPIEFKKSIQGFIALGSLIADELKNRFRIMQDNKK